VDHELIDPTEEHFGWQIAPLFAAQRARNDNRLKWEFRHARRDIPAATFACDDKSLAC
jgi:hypothetical protein